MALPSSGQITFQDIATELGLTGPITLDQAEVRALAGIPSGPISLADLAGKSALKLTATLTIGYAAEVIDKLSMPEYRGFWTRTHTSISQSPKGALDPKVIDGETICILVESRASSNSTMPQHNSFIFAVTDQTIPLDFFSSIKIKSGSTLLHTFNRADAASQRGVVYTGVDDYPATIYTWTLPTTAAGQVFPTSGTRTIEIG
jgi:hypothetical protein